ncbi:MAG: CPBP family intramembrane glutamic endopeptidase [Terriglobales bacterium]
MSLESYFHAPCWLCVRASAMQNYTIFDFILLAIALFLIPAQSVISGRKLSGAEPSKRALLRRYAITLVRGIAITVYVIALWRFTGRSFGLLGLSAPTDFSSQIGFILDIVLVAFFAIRHHRLGKLSAQQLAKLQKGFKNIRVVPRNSTEFSLFCAVAVIGSVWEELLFRGFLIWFFSPVVGLVGAVACSAIIFGLAHTYQGWRNIVGTALAGVVFAIGYVATRSLWWLIVAHAIMDILGGLYGLRVAMQSARTSDTTA